MARRVSLAILLVSFLMVFVPTAGAATCTSVEAGLSASKLAVVVSCVPTGTDHIGVAVMKNTKKEGLKEGINISVALAESPGYAPPSATPVVDLSARNKEGKLIGSWSPLFATVPGGEVPKETKRQELEKQLTVAQAGVAKLGKEQISAEELVKKLSGELGTAQALVTKISGEIEALPAEETSAEHEAKEKAAREAQEKAEREAREKTEREAKEHLEREAREKAEREQREREEREKLEELPHEEIPGEPVFFKGTDGGGWGATAELTDYKKLGAHPSVRLENPGNTSTFTQAGIHVVYLLNHYNTGGIKSVNISNYVKEVESIHTQDPLDPIEVENEPGGNWFWGGGAESETNAGAYDHLLKEAHVHVPGATLYASFDGGHAGNNAWGKAMLKADPGVVNYVTAFTEHPYDGSGANASSTLVHWNAVAEAHSATGKDIAITEYGRPLQASTGDSPKSTEAQQANADGAMVRMARSVGWVREVEIYGYRGDSSPCYAIFKGDGTPRPAVAAIAGS